MKPFPRREFLTAAGASAALALLPSRRSLSAEGPRRIAYYSERSDLDSGLACARMILSTFQPEEHFSIQDVAEMIYHREGYWVFEAQLLPILMKKDIRAGLHASTPYADLAAGRGLARYGPEADKRVDRKAMAWVNRFLSANNFLAEETDMSHVREWLQDGELLVLSVSRAVLRADPHLPYCRGNILLTGIQGQNLFYHDPAQGPHRRASIDLIRRAFEAPGTDRAVLRVLGSPQ